MFEISANKGLCDVIWGSEVKTSDLAAQFLHNSGAANIYAFVYYSNVQRTFKVQGWKNEVNRIYEAVCDETSQVNRSYVKDVLC